MQTESLNYLSRTDWPQSTWSDLPLPLTTSNSNNFMSATFGGDAGFIPLPTVAYASVDAVLNVPVSVYFPSLYASVILFSVSNTSSFNQLSITSYEESAFSLIGDSVFTFESSGNQTSTTLTTNSSFFDVAITGNYVARFTLSEFLPSDFTSMTILESN